MSEVRSEFSVLLAVVGLVVGGIMITHDGVTAGLRIGAALLALFALRLVYRLIANALVREQPRVTQRSYMDVAVEKS